MPGDLREQKSFGDQCGQQVRAEGDQQGPAGARAAFQAPDEDQRERQPEKAVALIDEGAGRQHEERSMARWVMLVLVARAIASCCVERGQRHHGFDGHQAERVKGRQGARRTIAQARDTTLLERKTRRCDTGGLSSADGVQPRPPIARRRLARGGTCGVLDPIDRSRVVL